MTIRVDNDNFIRDAETGLYIPEQMSAFPRMTHPLDDPRSARWTQQKTLLKRDANTGIVVTPGYGTGFDDFMMRSIVGGYIGNVGISPVIDPQFSTLVAKRQAMASTWQVLLSGRTLPTSRFLEVMSRANDGEGAGEFSKMYIGALDVDNRGAMFTQLPIETLAFDQWDEFGMNAIPIREMKTIKDNKFYLDVSPTAFRANRGLWMVDGLNCQPTGDPNWPYWIKKYSSDLGTDVWVLLHKDHVGQIIQRVGPRNNATAGYGQSGSWRYIKILLHEVLILEMDIEALLNQPPRGIVWGVGLDTPTQLRDQLTQFKTEKEENEILLYPGVFFGGSKSDKAKLLMVKWTEAPAGYTPDGWKKEKEDVLASCFHMSVAQIVTRLGEGAFTQSRVTDDIQAETGIAWMRSEIERVLNHVAPPRVTVTVNWLSDRAKRYQTETFDILSQGIQRIQQATEMQGFSVNEIRALVEQHGAIPIPDVPDDSRTAEVGVQEPVDIITPEIDDDPEPVQEEITEELTQKRPLSSLADLSLPDWVKYQAGNVVCSGDSEGVIIGYHNGRIEVMHDWHYATTPPSSTTYDPCDLTLVRFKGNAQVERITPIGSERPLPEQPNEVEFDLEQAIDIWDETVSEDWQGAIGNG